MGDLLQYFAGGRTVEVSRGTYSETLAVPQAEGHVVELAARAAVTLGKLWLTAAGGASILEEEIPAGTDQTRRRPAGRVLLMAFDECG